MPIFADAHNQRDRFERYLEMLLEHHVEALIVVANWLVVDIHVLADLSKRNIPAATIGWELPGDTVSSVMVDNETGGRMALEHLHQLGHRKIAFIRGPKMFIDSAPRWRGVQKFAHTAGLRSIRTGAATAGFVRPQLRVRGRPPLDRGAASEKKNLRR